MALKNYLDLANSFPERAFDSLVLKMKEEKGDRPVLYMPTMSAGVKTGERLERAFEKYRVSNIRLPFLVDKKSDGVIYPTDEEYQKITETMENSFGRNYIRMIWDEVLGEGVTALIVYDFLKQRGVRERDMILASLIDPVGISGGYCCIGEYGSLVSKRKKLEELKDDGRMPQKSSSIIRKVSSFFNGKDPDIKRTKELVKINDYRNGSEESRSRTRGLDVLDGFLSDLL